MNSSTWTTLLVLATPFTASILVQLIHSIILVIAILFRCQSHDDQVQLSRYSDVQAAAEASAWDLTKAQAVLVGVYSNYLHFLVTTVSLHVACNLITLGIRSLTVMEKCPQSLSTTRLSKLYTTVNSCVRFIYHSRPKTLHEWADLLLHVSRSILILALRYTLCYWLCVLLIASTQYAFQSYPIMLYKLTNYERNNPEYEKSIEDVPSKLGEGSLPKANSNENPLSSSFKDHTHIKRRNLALMTPIQMWHM